MTRRLLLASAMMFVLVLGVVWLYLHHNSQALDTARQARVLEMLREAKQIDADWNVDVLKALAEVHGNYDPLVRPLARLNTIVVELGSQARASRSAKVEKALSPVEDALSRKIELVESFKSQHALLKNSLRYIPTAYAEIQPAVHPWPVLERDLGNLVAGVLRYQMVPDEDTAKALRAATRRLRDASHAVPPALRSLVVNLLNHVDTVLRERALQTALLVQLGRPEMAQSLDALAAAFTRRFEQELGRQAEFQRYLVYYSGLALLLVMGAIGFVAYRGATEFRRMARAVDEATQARRQTETQLVHSEKMSMLGEVVSGIVHEINTPLGYLRSGLESSRENLNGVLRPHAQQTQRLLELLDQPDPDPAAVREQAVRLRALQARLRRSEVLEETSMLLNDGIDGVQQINETVVNLLNFSRIGRSRVVSCRVETGLESTLKLASHFLKTRQVVRRWGQTSEIECDLSQLNQVFLNVIKNAALATPADGAITIATSMAPGERLRVDITDNGSGIEAQDMSHIFDAFFTTRADGGGTGLGLSISQKIVQGHGGTMEVKSTPGQGTTFSILLPLTPPASLYAGPAT